jgi:hypothetical protein
VTATPRYHPDELIEPLVRWCGEHATACFEHVLTVGLALVHGYNEHQLGHIRIRDAAQLTITVPLSRHRNEMHAAQTDDVRIGQETDWLERAARAHIASHPDPNEGRLLFPARGRLQIPLPPQTFRQLVAEAGKRATGCRMSPSSLNQTRSARLIELGLPLPLLSAGYAPSWAVRLLEATPQPRPPRPA